jgi:hypothetical protein
MRYRPFWYSALRLLCICFYGFSDAFVPVLLRVFFTVSGGCSSSPGVIAVIGGCNNG